MLGIKTGFRKKHLFSHTKIPVARFIFYRSVFSMTQLYFRQLLAGQDFAVNNPFAGQMENCVYLIGDKEKGECVVVDPAWDIAGILTVAKQDNMRVTGALVTHYHPDHIGGSIFGVHIEGLSTLMALNPCKVHAHQLEALGVAKVSGISQNDIVAHTSGDKVKVGDVEIELLHTPGHTPGSQCFKVKNSLFSGDTLFLTGCGRVDLPGSSSEEMFKTLTQRLNSLPDDTILYPGHFYGGNHAPMSDVRKHNKYLKIKDLNEWYKIRG